MNSSPCLEKAGLDRSGESAGGLGRGSAVLRGRGRARGLDLHRLDRLCASSGDLVIVVVIDNRPLATAACARERIYLWSE